MVHWNKEPAMGAMKHTLQVIKYVVCPPLSFRSPGSGPIMGLVWNEASSKFATAMVTINMIQFAAIVNGTNLTL